MHHAKAVACLSALIALAPILAAAQTQPTPSPVIQTHPMEPSAVQPREVISGPYTFTLHGAPVAAKTVGVVVVTVSEKGALATDLVPYGGSSGIAGLVNQSTGATLHLQLDPAGTAVSTSVVTKPGAVPARVGGDMEISLPPLAAGTYTLRVHVRGAGAKVYTASFTLVAQ